jgi:hypothetical protein
MRRPGKRAKPPLRPASLETGQAMALEHAKTLGIGADATREAIGDRQKAASAA